MKINITHQGAPIVNHATEHQRYENVSLVNVDLASKYCKVDMYGDGEYPNVYLIANDESLHLNKDYDRNEPTHVEFPELAGWKIWSITEGKYTIYIAFYKDDPL